MDKFKIRFISIILHFSTGLKYEGDVGLLQTFFLFNKLLK